MFLVIPLFVISISLAGTFFIIYRKRNYLNKLYSLNNAGTNESYILTGSDLNWKYYGAEFFPEIKAWLERLKLYEHRGKLLLELEKFLRRTRLIFLRIDRWSDALIKKIRRVHLNGQLNGKTSSQSPPTLDIQNNEDTTLSTAEQLVQPQSAISPVFLKNEEKQLIIEIAKNPKNYQLYEALGDLYIEMENWTDAKESYEAAIELNPQNEFLKQKLSSALEKLSSRS